MVLRQHGRMHAHLNGVPLLLADGQQLDLVTQQFGSLKILCRQFGNALAVDDVDGHVRVKRHRGQDGQLVHRVVPFHIGSGIGFRVAQRLRLLQHLVECAPFLGHLGQNVVCRAIDDAHDALDVVGLHGVRNGTDNGDAAAHRRLQIQPCAGLLGRRLELVPVLAHDLLVRRDDRLAAGERAQNERARRFHPAHALDHDADARILQDVVDRRGKQLPRRQVQVGLVFKISYEDMGNLQIQLFAVQDVPMVLRRNAVDAGADGAKAEDCNGVGGHAESPLLYDIGFPLG